MASLQLLATAMLVLFPLRIYYLRRKMSTNLKEAPRVGGAWPIIGHLHLLAQVELPHIFYGAMSDKYGPAFMIQLGMRRALVVNSADIAKECFTTNDKALATRPRSIAVEIMGYDYGMFAFTQYGPYWREVRRIVVEFLSNRQLEFLKHVRVSEVSTCMKDLYQSWEKQNKTLGHGAVLVEMKQWFNDITQNISVRMVCGNRYFGASATGDENETRTLQKAIKEFFRFTGAFIVSAYLPFLRWLDLGGYQKKMKGLARELDAIVQELLDKHKKSRQTDGDKGDQDFMDVMLSVVEDGNLSDYDADMIIKATSFVLIIAASDSTMATLTWAVCLLLNNPLVMKKAQDELDIHIGKDRPVEESDIKKLVYLRAIIKETLRLYPAGPLAIPHEAMEDCTVAGYHVPAGTCLLLNIWKIQRDPLLWPNPSKFQPERFLNSNVDVGGQHFEFLPFGAGRRACPGTSLAFQVVSLTLARLLHEFNLSNPSECKIDMSQCAGLVAHKVTPLEVLIRPRLSPKFYEH